MPKTPPQSKVARDAVEAVYASTDHLTQLGVDPDDPRALGDATAVLTYIRRQPLVPRGTLATWSATTWGDGGVDRLNAAMNFLTRAKLIGQVGD